MPEPAEAPAALEPPELAGLLELLELLELPELLAPLPLGEPAVRGGLEQDEPADVVVLAVSVVVEPVVVEPVAAEPVADEPAVAEPVAAEGPCTDDAAVPSADGELELSEDAPLPHAVSTPPAINEPATNSVHERTPVLLMATPRQ